MEPNTTNKRKATVSSHRGVGSDVTSLEPFLQSRSEKRLKLTPNLEHITTLTKPDDSTPYCYQALSDGEIRVLCLEPGQFGSPLCARLEHVLLPAGPPPHPPRSYRASEIYKTGPTGSSQEEMSETDEDQSDSDDSDGADDAKDLGDSDGADAEEQPDHVDDADDVNNSSDSDDSVVDYDDVRSNESDLLPLEPSRYYEAISYVWGEQYFPHEIHLTGARVIRITASLYSALQHFRYETGLRRIWVDAVCINQTDDDERSAQVAQMGRIFRCAECVLVWLGPSQSSDTLAFAGISALSRLTERLIADLTNDGNLTIYELERRFISMTTCTCCGEQFEKPANLALSSVVATSMLLERAWFTRVWVVQEVRFAEKERVLFFSGFHTSSFREFLNMMVLLAHMSRTDRKRLFAATPESSRLQQNIILQHRFFETFAHVITDIPALLSILINCFDRRCLDPRDRVLAVYSILDVKDFWNFDFAYHIPTVEVYRRFILACLSHPTTRKQGSDLPYSVFAMVGTATNAIAEQQTWASWVPDFHHLTQRSEEKFAMYYRSSPQWGSLDVVAKWKVDLKDEGALQLSGNVFAKIVSVLADSAFPIQAEQSEFVSNLLQWYQRCLDFVQICWGHLDCHEQFVHLLSCNTSLGHENYAPKPDDNQDSAEVWRAASTALLYQYKELKSHEDSPVDALLQCIFFTRGPRPDLERFLCIVKGKDFNHVAWIPRSANEGDFLCAFYGAQYPFVIRKRADAAYTLLGDAFTLETTLMEALGGPASDERTAHCEVDDVEYFNDWNSEDEGMKQLIESLDWITLR